MRNLKFFRNLIIAVLGIFVTFFVLSIVKEDVGIENSKLDNKNTHPTTSVVSTGNKIKSYRGVNLIITSPKANTLVNSPMQISGRAPGDWFFEGKMNATLTNWDGLIIAEGNVDAIGNWMTEDYIPFNGQLKFTKPDYGERGFLILHKNNPSNKPLLDDSVEITVKLN